MSGFLLDTSVLSAFAPDRPRVAENLQRWILDQGDRGTLFVSTIVILEIQRGIAKLRRSGGKTRADRLDQWLSGLVADFNEQVLSVDLTIAKLAGELEDGAIALGRSPGLADVLIAATAKSHGLIVLTTNVRHFAVLDIPHIDPFAQELPQA